MGRRMTDDDFLPFQKGKFAGYRLGKIPDWWFRWFLQQDWCDDWPDLVEYANVIVEDED
jgi:uncharacterized protein (DUF3820 family)